MMLPRHSFVSLAAGLALVPLAGGTGAIAAELDMAPYRLVRSLQRIQDQIADGDKAAIGMQLEMTKYVDQSFRQLDSNAFADPRTAKALIEYSMLGGNPETLEAHISDLGDEDSALSELGYAVLAYQKGASTDALERLKTVDPVRMGGIFGASLALVRGLMTESDREAADDFDVARLLAPGTLIEEAALRRLMSIHRRDRNSEAFLRVTSRYARRFVASPYALQFAQEFAAGVAALADLLNPEDVVEILDFMPKPYRESLTLRLMHVATIEGRFDIVSHIAPLAPTEASGGGTEEEAPAELSENAVRQQFYSLIADITSGNVHEVAEELRKIDPDALTEGDRNLLRAVLAIADAVTGPAEVVPEQYPVRQADAGGSILFDASEQQQIEPVLNDFEDFVVGTRTALESVDELLEEIQ